MYNIPIEGGMVTVDAVMVGDATVVALAVVATVVGAMVGGGTTGLSGLQSTPASSI